MKIGSNLINILFEYFMNKYSISLLILTIFYGCSKDNNDGNVMPPLSSPNIILILADDLGKDAISGFGEGIIKPNTPHIDAIRNSGITFSNMWVYPTCSPTRASIITGKYGYRTGVKWAGDVLESDEIILHNYVKTQTNNKYATALIGKWHLAGEGTSNFNPEILGMDYYSGLLSGGGGYSQWTLSENGVNSNQNSYITEKFTDLAIDWINIQEKPWFLWLAYTAPHTPFHIPPSEMHSQGNLPEYVQGMDALPYYLAAIEAMDYQIGRLLDSMPVEERLNTTIIFVGDNGTPNQVAQSPYSSSTAKGSLFQGGINTPMFISGASVSRVAVENSLVTGTDLFATIAAMAGVSVSQIHDSKSFVSLLSTTTSTRKYQYSEMNNGTFDRWTIRNDRFKLIVSASGEEEFYDLTIDPYENSDLLDGTLSNEQIQGKAELETELLQIRN